MTGTIMPFPKHQFFNANGDPAAAYRLFLYAAGTSTKQGGFSDAALTTPLANPTTLDAGGFVAAGGVFLTPGLSYKVLLALPGSDDPPASVLWNIDLVQSVPPTGTASDTDLGSQTAGENIAAGNAVYLSDGSGGNTAGRWYRTDADFTYASSNAGQVGMAPSAMTTGNSGSIRIGGRITGLSGLTIGALYYASATAGALTAVPPTNARAIGVADTTSSLIVSPWSQGIEASATTPGLITAQAQTIAGAKTLTGQASFTGGAPTYTPGAAASALGTVSGLLPGSVDTTQHANSGTGETTLSSYSLPANVLSANGKTIKITVWGTFAANANTKTVKIKFGASSITVLAAATNGGGWRATAYVVRTGAATQKMVADLVNYTGTGTTGGTASPTETLSGAVTILTTGQSGTASSDILQEFFAVEVLG